MNEPAAIMRPTGDAYGKEKAGSSLVNCRRIRTAVRPSKAAASRVHFRTKCARCGVDVSGLEVVDR